MSYIYWNDGLKKNVCDEIITSQNKLKNFPPGSNSKFSPNRQLEDNKWFKRNCNMMINYIQNNDKLNHTIEQYFRQSNKLFNYNIMKFSSPQFTIYNKGDYYKYHQDRNDFERVSGDNLFRKISMTIQLSTQSQYKGGDLEFYNGDEEELKLEIRNQGTVICFDSRMWHRVSEIQSGIRYSLVSFAYGED